MRNNGLAYLFVSSREKMSELKKKVVSEIKKIYDPEIPVNIYSLGLIYCVEVVDGKEDAEDAANVRDVYVRMTLTSPACPVAQEMPVWVQNAIFAIDGVGQVEVEIVWDPAWDPSYMSETAKLELNMF